MPSFCVWPHLWASFRGFSGSDTARETVTFLPTDFVASWTTAFAGSCCSVALYKWSLGTICYVQRHDASEAPHGAKCHAGVMSQGLLGRLRA
jgi:hypothetical protein